MKVRALERGFVGRLIEKDEVFEIEADQLAPWMEAVEDAKPKRQAKAPAAEQPTEDLA